MGYRSFSSLRGRRDFGGKDDSNGILCRPYSKETGRRYLYLRSRGNDGGFHPREPFLPSDHHLAAEGQDQLYRLYHVWKPHWWICILPGLTYIGGCSTFRSVSSRGGAANCFVQSRPTSRSRL